MSLHDTTRYLTVTDDWGPNFEGNKVRAHLFVQKYKGYTVKLCIYGADEFGIEKETVL